MPDKGQKITPHICLHLNYRSKSPSLIHCLAEKMSTPAAIDSTNIPKTSDEDVAGRLQFCVSMLGGITATRISDDIGVSVSAVTKWLRSGRITRPHLVDFAYRYDVNLEWLMTGLGSMRGSSSKDGGDNTVPVYALEHGIYSGGTVLFSEKSHATNYVHVGEDHLSHFAVEANCPEVDPRIGDGKIFVFRSDQSTPEAGSLVAVVRKKGKATVMLRVVEEQVDGSLSFVAQSSRVPDFSEDDVLVAGVCVQCISPGPAFF
jgi:hypothetical protein